MKKNYYFIIYLVLIIIFLASCEEKNESNKDKCLVEASIYDGWSDYSSIKINKNGKSYIQIQDQQNNNTFYTISIKKAEMDSVIFLLNKIKLLKVDFIHKAICSDCGFYDLILEEQKLFHVDNISNSNEEIKDLNQLVKLLIDIINTSKKELTIQFNFKSRLKMNHVSPPIVKK